MAIISIIETNKALNEIRLHNNLKLFRENQCEEFCKKYDITPGQFNFLISVVAVERIEKVKSKKSPI